MEPPSPSPSSASSRSPTNPVPGSDSTAAAPDHTPSIGTNHTSSTNSGASAANRLLQLASASSTSSAHHNRPGTPSVSSSSSMADPPAVPKSNAAAAALAAASRTTPTSSPNPSSPVSLSLPPPPPISASAAAANAAAAAAASVAAAKAVAADQAWRKRSRRTGATALAAQAAHSAAAMAAAAAHVQAYMQHPHPITGAAAAGGQKGSGQGASATTTGPAPPPGVHAMVQYHASRASASAASALMGASSPTLSTGSTTTTGAGTASRGTGAPGPPRSGTYQPPSAQQQSRPRPPQQPARSGSGTRLPAIPATASAQPPPRPMRTNQAQGRQQPPRHATPVPPAALVVRDSELAAANDQYADHLRARVKQLRAHVAATHATYASSMSSSAAPPSTASAAAEAPAAAAPGSAVSTEEISEDPTLAAMRHLMSMRLAEKRARLVLVQEKQLSHLVHEKKRAAFNEKRRLDRAKARRERELERERERSEVERTLKEQAEEAKRRKLDAAAAAAAKAAAAEQVRRKEREQAAKAEAAQAAAFRAAAAAVALSKQTAAVGAMAAAMSKLPVLLPAPPVAAAGMARGGGIPGLAPGAGHYSLHLQQQQQQQRFQLAHAAAVGRHADVDAASGSDGSVSMSSLASPTSEMGEFMVVGAGMNGATGKRQQGAKESTPGPASSTAAAGAKSASAAATSTTTKPTKSSRPVNPEHERARIWRTIALTWIPKFSRSVHSNALIKQNNAKRFATLMERHALRLRRPHPRDIATTKAKKMAKQAVKFWAENEKLEREAQRRIQQEALERQRQAEVMREQQRQQRKLNFLLSQTELFTHFVSKKMGGAGTVAENGSEDQPPVQAGQGEARGEGAGRTSPLGADVPGAAIKALDEIDFDDDAEAEAQARLHAQEMAERHGTRGTTLTRSVKQPKMLMCELKEYQLKGLEWLISLYEQGINGILADEMGLGKTVQSIALLSWLAENNNLWGPYLIVTPVSTLHNWQQELARFVPSFKVIPYWGDPKDRTILRQFWAKRNQVYDRESPAHVVVTSYQNAITDLKYLSGVEWEYMILDEAQAIKSSDSLRWNSLLQVKSRNRLLLTGTPVQNSMKELWALLHFIMPTLFDSHAEFNEWFSRDIESAAVNKKQMNAEQVKRLHTILQPFMLRRLKRDVQSELGEKIEVNVSCGLSKKQQLLYRMIKNKLSIRDILESMRNGGTARARASLRANAAKTAKRKAAAAAAAAAEDGSDPLAVDAGNVEDEDEDQGDTLANVVMQLRKVCNHPELLERAETVSPFVMMPPMGAKAGPWVPLYDNDCVSVRAESAIVTRYPRRLAGLACNVADMRVCVGQEGAVETVFRVPLGELGPIWLTGYAGPQVEQVRWSLNLLKRYQYHEQVTSVLPRTGRALVMEPTEKDPVVRRIKQDSTLLDVNPDWYPPSLDLYQAKATASSPLEWEYIRHTPGHSVTSAFHPLLWPPPYEALESPTAVPLISEIETGASTLTVAQPTIHDMMPLLPQVGMPSFVRVPDMRDLIAASGKLQALDTLLPKLKGEGHRCLLYFQMTRMMDVVEQYLTYRKHSYLRLDGSTELGERRDLVSDWQTRDDLFCFLLSTRAGGVGINLTAADTVIFVENDWNPTSDKQAMDRAHRLGQTKQVTVYRLFTRHTIEERILERARTKDEIQRVVISGAPGAEDQDESLAPSSKEMMSLLFGDEDDAEMRALLESEMKRDQSATMGANGSSGSAATATDNAGGPSGSSANGTGAKRSRKRGGAAAALAGGDTASDLGSPVGAGEVGGSPAPKRKRKAPGEGTSKGRKRALPDSTADGVDPPPAKRRQTKSKSAGAAAAGTESGSTSANTSLAGSASATPVPSALGLAPLPLVSPIMVAAANAALQDHSNSAHASSPPPLSDTSSMIASVTSVNAAGGVGDDFDEEESEIEI